jgi:hypothetical protein
MEEGLVFFEVDTEFLNTLFLKLVLPGVNK